MQNVKNIYDADCGLFSCDTLYWRVLDIKYSRRASLAVALLQEPELLILDEPTVRSNMIKMSSNMIKMSHFHYGHFAGRR